MGALRCDLLDCGRKLGTEEGAEGGDVSSSNSSMSDPTGYGNGLWLTWGDSWMGYG